MDFPKLQQFVERIWQAEVVPALCDYIAIPCESPAFDPDWDAHGRMQRAVELMTGWARERLAAVPGASVETLRLPGRTPLIFIDIPASGSGGAPVLIYGHLDKQPPMAGWAAGRSAWMPSLE